MTTGPYCGVCGGLTEPGEPHPCGGRPLSLMERTALLERNVAHMRQQRAALAEGVTDMQRQLTAMRRQLAELRKSTAAVAGAVSSAPPVGLLLRSPGQPAMDIAQGIVEAQP